MRHDHSIFLKVWEILGNHTGESRVMIGLTGPPASGKTFIAGQLVDLVNQTMGSYLAASISMDGFHYHDDYLRSHGLYAHKGAHFTFDVNSFVAKLSEISRGRSEITCPTFDHDLGNPVPAGQLIKAQYRIIFVEGNYLLLHVPPWNTIQDVLDCVVYLSVDAKAQFDRLLKRHISAGKSEKEARDKIIRTDLTNTELIRKDRLKADFVFESS